MEEIEEQALLADKVLKDGEDAPMEGDEIGHEEADTALVEDDDHGSEYDIDDYLDENGKLLSTFIHTY